MPTVTKGFKYRLYPTIEQANQINQTIGCCRFVFNYALAQQRKQEELYRIVEEMKQCGQLPMDRKWKATFFKPNTSKVDLPKLKENHPFLNRVDSIALQNSIERLGFGYERFYEKENGKPKFKSKRNPVQSYTTKCVNHNISIEGNRIKLPKLGWVKFANSKQIDGKIINATIRKTPTNKYYVSVTAEVEIKSFAKTTSETGIDLGLKDFAILSDGTKIANPKTLRKYESKLAKLQRQLSRQTQGGKNYEKTRLAIAKLHEKIANIRNDFLNKLSTNVVRENQTISMEDLQVQNMIRNHNLAKSITDVSWSEFVRQIEYKSKWHERDFVQISKTFPSSQLCSSCGYKNPLVKQLALRKWECPNCHEHHDRDINASINILQEGKRLLTLKATA